MEFGLKTILSGFFALAWLVAIMPLSANAGSGTIDYKPGAIKAASDAGKAVLLHYNTTW